MSETILIVDDEESVRRTFHEWLGAAGLDCQILTASDAESALVQANKHPIDLAILDWNLGAGSDGLQLLEDLYVFNRDVVAIMITGYAHQATPLAAMRMGVRDYLDKNQDLDRDTFLAAVRRQLDRIRPAKHERRFHQGLLAFREAVDKVLPLVQSTAALNDPVPLPEAVRSLFRFLLQATRARDGVLLVRSHDPDRQPAEVYRVYNAAGSELAVDLVPFSRSIAGTIVSMQNAAVMNDLGKSDHSGAVELQPFERGRHSLLAAPLPIAPGVQAVLELFDKQSPGAESGTGFTDDDLRLVRATAEFGVELFRQALAERQTHQTLFDAVAAALGAGESLAETLRGTGEQRLEQPPPDAVMDRLREGFSAAPGAGGDADESVRLAEAIRVLALRHGTPALRHCTGMVESLRKLLDAVGGYDGEVAP